MGLPKLSALLLGTRASTPGPSAVTYVRRRLVGPGVNYPATSIANASGTHMPLGLRPFDTPIGQVFFIPAPAVEPSFFFISKYTTALADTMVSTGNNGDTRDRSLVPGRIVREPR